MNEKNNGLQANKVAEQFLKQKEALEKIQKMIFMNPNIEDKFREKLHIEINKALF